VNICELALLAPGLHSELAIKLLASPDDNESTTLMHLSQERNNITNALSLTMPSLSGNPTGPAPPWNRGHQVPQDVTVWSSSNDEYVRAHDAATCRERTRINLHWAVNYTAFSYHDSAFVAVGDDTSVAVVDPRSGERHMSHAHRDFVFAAAWSPTDPCLFATGAQDATVRFWDVRALGRGSLAVMPAITSAVRSIRFSPDGQYIAFSEPGDFVHVHSMNNLNSGSVEDFFGEICGIDFAPDSQSLFIGLSDQRYGGLVELERQNAPQTVEEPEWSSSHMKPLYIQSDLTRRRAGPSNPEAEAPADAGQPSEPNDEALEISQYLWYMRDRSTSAVPDPMTARGRTAEMQRTTGESEREHDSGSNEEDEEQGAEDMEPADEEQDEWFDANIDDERGLRAAMDDGEAEDAENMEVDELAVELSMDENDHAERANEERER